MKIEVKKCKNVVNIFFRYSNQSKPCVMSAIDIKSKVSDIIESKSNAELIIDLLAVLEEDSNSSKLRGIHALNKAWTHVIRRGDIKSEDNKEDSKYQTWIREVFDQTWNKLLVFISEEDKRVANLAISTVVGFIVTIHETNNKGRLPVRNIYITNLTYFKNFNL